MTTFKVEVPRDVAEFFESMCRDGKYGECGPEEALVALVRREIASQLSLWECQVSPEPIFSAGFIGKLLKAAEKESPGALERLGGFHRWPWTSKSRPRSYEDARRLARRRGREEGKRALAQRPELARLNAATPGC